MLGSRASSLRAMRAARPACKPRGMPKRTPATRPRPATTPPGSATLKDLPMKMPNARPRAVPVMLLLPLLCAACAPRLPASTAAPIPTLQEMPDLPPALAKPPPPESYSEKALARIKSWQERLTSSATK